MERNWGYLHVLWWPTGRVSLCPVLSLRWERPPLQLRMSSLWCLDPCWSTEIRLRFPRPVPSSRRQRLQRKRETPWRNRAKTGVKTAGHPIWKSCLPATLSKCRRRNEQEDAVRRRANATLMTTETKTTTDSLTYIMLITTMMTHLQYFPLL